MKPLLRWSSLLILFSLLLACGREDAAEERVVYIELPGSHVLQYAHAVGTVTGEEAGRLKIRIDEIHATPSSDHPMLRDLQRGRFVQLPAEAVLDARAGQVAVAHWQRLMQALAELQRHVLTPEQVPPEVVATLRKAADNEALGGRVRDEIACAAAVHALQTQTPIYRAGRLQIDTAAAGLAALAGVLEAHGRFEAARRSLHRPASPDACIAMAVRLVRESDFDLQGHVASLLGSDIERLKQAMQPVRALNHALLDFQTGHFAEVPDGMDPERYEQARLAALTSDLRRRFAYNYIRDFRHDINQFQDEKAVIERFQRDLENARPLAELLGGPILDERHLEQDYLNYFRLNRKLPSEMSRQLDDDDFFQRAKDGFVVIQPSDPQRLEGLRLYLQHYPEGRHAEEAKRLIAEIEQRLRAGASGKPNDDTAAGATVPAAAGVPPAPPEIPSMLPEENPRDLPPEDAP